MRKCRFLLGLVLLTALGLCDPLVAQPIAAPAETMLRGWLDAFNKDEGRAVVAFDALHAPWLSEQQVKQLRGATGGYDLIAIDAGSRLWLRFHVKRKVDGKELVGFIVVKPRDPMMISELRFRPVEEHVGAALTKSDRRVVVVNLSRSVRETYVYPAAAKHMAQSILAHSARGAYDSIADGEILATRLTDDLQAIAGDRHLSVRYSPEIVPPDFPPDRPPPAPPEPDRTCGFSEAKLLGPSVGYLKIDRFADPGQCSKAAQNAISAIKSASALIVDLRDNRGGAPDMAAVVASTLFGARTHLDDIYDRGGTIVKPIWTHPELTNEIFAGRVFILTSRRTFSAAEQFCYDLKALHRATIVGETTGGGAHLVSPRRLGDHFFAEIPFGRFINPITKTDWEGVGVAPDVPSDAGAALDIAVRLANAGS